MNSTIRLSVITLIRIVTHPHEIREAPRQNFEIIHLLSLKSLISHQNAVLIKSSPSRLSRQSECSHRVWQKSVSKASAPIELTLACPCMTWDISPMADALNLNDQSIHSVPILSLYEFLWLTECKTYCAQYFEKAVHLALFFYSFSFNVYSKTVKVCSPVVSLYRFGAPQFSGGVAGLSA